MNFICLMVVLVGAACTSLHQSDDEYVPDRIRHASGLLTHIVIESITEDRPDQSKIKKTSEI